MNPNEYTILATTEPFDHCCFTVRADFPPEREQLFLRVLYSMSYDNPKHREMMDLEGLKAWVPGRTSGYGLLHEAVERQHFLRELGHEPTAAVTRYYGGELAATTGAATGPAAQANRTPLFKESSRATVPALLASGHFQLPKFRRGRAQLRHASARLRHAPARLRHGCGRSLRLLPLLARASRRG